MDPRPEPEGTAQERASFYYRPEYERLRWGGRTLHIFWFRDRNDRRTHQMILRTDPREPARAVRADLAQLSKTEFELKYAPYRLEQLPGTGDRSS